MLLTNPLLTRPMCPGSASPKAKARAREIAQWRQAIEQELRPRRRRTGGPLAGGPTPDRDS